VLRQRSVFIAASIAIAALALSACAIVDKYSDRAIEFNLQAEKTQQQNLLLNIVRASLRRPMQFTGLASITGNATASGGVAGGYTNQHQTPFFSQFPTPPPANTLTVISRVVTGTGSATGSLSGGQTFTVPVLDTQEFYQGILQPLAPQIIDYYVKQGYQLQILFDLFIASVEVIATNSPKCERFTFKNDVRDQVSFGQFQAVSDYLLSSGFTTERISEIRPYGPPISMAHVPSNATETALMVDAYSKAASAGLDFGRGGEARRGQSNPTLNLQKRSSRYRFCFTRDIHQAPNWLGGLEEQAYCGYANVRTPAARRSPERCGIVGGEQGGGEGGTSQFYDIKFHSSVLERFRQIRNDNVGSYHSPENFFPIERFRNKDVTFRFHIRSVESIIYYLGEITRQTLHAEDGNHRTMQVKTNLRYGTLPPEECNPIENGGRRQTKRDLLHMTSRRTDPRTYNCENLFVLETGPAPDAFYSVSYDGQTYSIPSDPARAGRTLQVLELLKQLLALHTSAKSLPQSSVISIVGGTAQ
jgi:hypothetical protein